MFALLVLSVLVLRLTAAAVMRHPNATNLDFPDVECTKSRDWVGLELIIEDCDAALNRFNQVEVLRHGGKRFEFLGVGAEPVSKLGTMQTPRRYTVGKLEPLEEEEKQGKAKSGMIILIWAAR